MRFVKGADVFSAAGEKLGTISRIVIDVKTRDVTDLVVERGILLKEEKVVPVGLVDLENEGRIILRETNQDVDDFLNYETTHYVPVDPPGVHQANIEVAYWYPPANPQIQMPIAGVFQDNPSDTVSQTQTAIPEGRVAIAEGAQVVGADGKHIGNVEQVITNSNSITHFVIGKGFLLKEHKLVPASWVDNVKEDKIHLAVEAPLFERLPGYKPD